MTTTNVIHHKRYVRGKGYVDVKRHYREYKIEPITEYTNAISETGHLEFGRGKMIAAYVPAKNENIALKKFKNTYGIDGKIIKK